MPDLNLYVIAPEIAIVGTAMLVLIAGLFIDEGRNEWLAALSLGGLAAASVAIFGLWDMRGAVGLGGMATADQFALFLAGVFVAIAALTVLTSVAYRPIRAAERGEYYALVLFATAGMMLMAAGTDLIVLFLGLEMFSISLYVLAGFLRPQERSEESALKYFLLGAFASGFLLYGIALTFGATGATNLAAIAGFVASKGLHTPMLLMGLGLILVGFGFKIAMAPFHMWTPDVYEGAPTTITGFMAAGTKAAGFAALLRILTQAFPSLQPDWVPILAILAVVTMTLGNVVAIWQTNIKRMLAYSSIAHAGYILVAVVAATNEGMSAALYYLLVYALMNLGAFAVIVALGRRDREYVNISDFGGLSAKQPALALAMALFMLSLAGFPPTGGFVGKFYVFRAAVNANLVWLAVFGVLNSVVSVYYYLRIVVLMYMSEPTEEPAPAPVGWLLGLSVAVAAVGVLVLGLWPAGVTGLAQVALLP
ncbi:MAG: NADH-quinone oxidoreductase subunit N [Anaerolineae bacterium]